MPIHVILPVTLRTDGPRTLRVEEPVSTVAELLSAVEREAPGLGAQLADAAFNVAVNDHLILHRVGQHPLRDGDTVEFVPAIAGG